MATRIPTLSSQNVRHVSPDELYSVVCDAASLDPSKLQSSSERLKQMFEMTGTCDALSEISSQRTLPLQVRQQSIIQLKNCVLNHWRSRRLLPEEHRARIRARCLLLLDESDDIIAECNELITSKIARSDYPIQWPNLANDLSNVIQQNITARYSGHPSSFLPLRRSLEILNAVIKELSSTRMMTGVKNMGQIVEQQHLALQAYYSTIAPFLNALDPSTISTQRSSEDILLAHLVFKCLAKCAAWLFYRVKDNESKAKIEPWLRELFQNSVVQLRTLSELRINLLLALRTSQPSLGLTTQQNIINLTRHVLLFGKFFRRLQQLDSPRFVQLPACSDLVLYYWSKVVQATNGPPELIEDAPTAVFPVRYLVQAMVVFKESLAQWAPVRKDGSPNEQVLSREFVEEAVKLLVTRFIPLNPSDLEEWMADPEEWVNLEEKENEQWQYELRPCGERVLMTLAGQCQDYVRPLLVTTWKQVRAQPSTDLTSILQKEALYCAIGRCAMRLKDVIPFEEWLATDLTREAQETNPSYPIIKRRIAWLIGKWISGECSNPNNVKIWEVLTYLLRDRGSGTDAVVRLTAAVALQECVDTLEFDLGTFAPFLPSVVPELLRLQSEADTLESKRRIANSLNTVIERAGTNIVPLMGIIADPLPQLWITAGEDWLFKASLLGTVSKLIGSTKEHSAPLCALVVPLVRDSFTPAAKVQLDEDALELWQAALRNTTTIDSVNGAPGLSELLPLAITALSENLDILNRITGVVESYCLLDPFRILQAFAVDLFSAAKTIIPLAPSTNTKTLMVTINILLQLAPAELWGEALHISGLFVEIVKALDEEKASSMLLLEYIFFMSRVALGNGQVFRELIRKTGPILNVSEEQVYNIVLTQWWTRFDNMYEPRHRKLAAMGIAALVATGQPEVLDRLATEVCNIWLDVFGEIREARESAAENDGQPLALYWDQPPEDLFQEVQGMPEFNRRMAAYESDPVRTQLLTAFITARLQEAEAACGGGAVLQEKWFSKADPIVLEQLKKELSGA